MLKKAQKSDLVSHMNLVCPPNLDTGFSIGKIITLTRVDKKNL